MKSQTSLVARSCRIQEWAAMVQECKNRPEGMSVDEWCHANNITKANYYYRLTQVRKACLESEVHSLTSQQFRWLMEGLTIAPKKVVQEVEPPEFVA